MFAAVFNRYIVLGKVVKTVKGLRRAQSWHNCLQQFSKMMFLHVRFFSPFLVGHWAPVSRTMMSEVAAANLGI